MGSRKQQGVSLIELMIYLAILAVLAGLFVNILTTSTRVQISEVATNEVGNQLNFVLQTIQRLVRESSNIETAANDDPATPLVNEGDNPETTSITELAYLKLRLPASASDPTCISLVESAPASGQGVIRLTQGPAGVWPNDLKCKASNNTDSIITDKVFIPLNPLGLTFKKLSNFPAHDSVEISLTLNYASTNPQSQASRNLKTAIGRVSAATFDSNLIPGLNNSYDIGQNLTRWKELFVQDLDVDGVITQRNNFNAGNRGTFLISAPSGAGNDCNTICNNHVGTGGCVFASEAISTGLPVTDYYFSSRTCSDTFTSPYGGLCYCR